MQPAGCTEVHAFGEIAKGGSLKCADPEMGHSHSLLPFIPCYFYTLTRLDTRWLSKVIYLFHAQQTEHRERLRWQPEAIYCSSHTVWTDYKNLAYIQSAKHLNSHQAWWALFFGQFKFNLTYRPGSKNVKPDTLFHGDRGSSPVPDTILPPSCLIGSLT